MREISLFTKNKFSQDEFSKFISKLGIIILGIFDLDEVDFNYKGLKLISEEYDKQIKNAHGLSVMTEFKQRQMLITIYEEKQIYSCIFFTNSLDEVQKDDLKSKIKETILNRTNLFQFIIFDKNPDHNDLDFNELFNKFNRSIDYLYFCAD